MVVEGLETAITSALICHQFNFDLAPFAVLSSVLVMRELAMSAKIEPLLTIADLEAMPDDGKRYELIEGEIIVSRAPSLSHQRLPSPAMLAGSGRLTLRRKRFFA